MLKNIFKQNILKNFFSIPLSAVEKEVAEMSVKEKYVICTKRGFLYGLMMLPAILFLDSGIVINVLIPVTIVAGTAWYSVSLTSVKKKFELFGFELTVDLFSGFVTSLFLLCMLVIVKLNPVLFQGITLRGEQVWRVQGVAGILGSIVLLKLCFDIFLGSLKYDINDSMLAGQSEAAELFFKRSLSLLSVCADHLKTKHDTQVSHYYIGLAFYEIFTYVTEVKGKDPEIDLLIHKSSCLKEDPSVDAKMGKEIGISLIADFLKSCTNIEDERTKKSYQNIASEMYSLQRNTQEGQELINIRLAIIFEEMRDMIDAQGESLFVQRLEVEGKYLVESLPEKLDQYEKKDIIQGYLEISDQEETRIRKANNVYTKTTKRYHPSGFRDEIEVYLTQAMFEELRPQTQGKRVEKTRYLIPFGEYMIEFDQFHGAHEGLLMAEIEYPSLVEMESTSIPDRFGKDVTHDKNYKNKNLAR